LQFDGKLALEALNFFYLLCLNKWILNQPLTLWVTGKIYKTARESE